MSGSPRKADVFLSFIQFETLCVDAVNHFDRRRLLAALVDREAILRSVTIFSEAKDLAEVVDEVERTGTNNGTFLTYDSSLGGSDLVIYARFSETQEGAECDVFVLAPSVTLEPPG